MLITEGGFSLRETALNLPASRLLPRQVRARLYRWLGIKINTWQIRSGCFFDSRNVRIGQGSFINVGCFFNARHAAIDIGRRCYLAPEVMICTSTHEIGTDDRRAGRGIGLPVSVGDGCWIGARATLLPGVTVRDRCVIAAGSVVTKDCDRDGLYAGVPARRVRDL